MSPIDKINPISGVLHPDLPIDTVRVIDTTLGTKLRIDGVIDKEFTEAVYILSATNSASEYLYHLLIINHPKLSPISLAIIGIPNYSTSKCLYKSAKALKSYIYVQGINGRTYTDKR